MLRAADKAFIEYLLLLVAEALLMVQHGLRHSFLETQPFRMDSKLLPLLSQAVNDGNVAVHERIVGEAARVSKTLVASPSLHDET
jgi:hypothetical protein